MVIKKLKKQQMGFFPQPIFFTSNGFLSEVHDLCISQDCERGEERKLFLHISLSDRGKENTSIALNKPEKVFPLDCSNSISIYCISSVLPRNCVKALNVSKKANEALDFAVVTYFH